VLTQPVQPRTNELTVASFVVMLIAAGNLKLDHRLPQRLVCSRRGVERSDQHVSVLTPMSPNLPALCDQADALVQVIATSDKLVMRQTHFTIDAVPRERLVAHARVVAEFQLEQLLPATRIPGARRPIEHQQISPMMRRVARRTNEQVAVL